MNPHEKDHEKKPKPTNDPAPKPKPSGPPATEPQTEDTPADDSGSNPGGPGPNPKP